MLVSARGVIQAQHSRSSLLCCCTLTGYASLPGCLRAPQAKGCIKVLNNGAGIPVEVHKTEGIYVPELIFGNLLTSSNYNDTEKKVGGVTDTCMCRSLVP